MEGKTDNKADRKTDKICIGILGCGFAGQLHREAIAEMEEREKTGQYHLLCIADPKIKGMQDVKFFYDYKKLLDKQAKDLDAVIIALPTTMHLQAVRDSLDCGLAVLLEKPMAANAEDAMAIQNLTATKNAKLMIAMTGRYHPEFAAAYTLLSSGMIGELTGLSECIHLGEYPFPMQYLDKAQCGRGVGLTNGIHTVDRFLWFTGCLPSDVKVDHIGNEFFQREVEDNLRGTMVFENKSKNNKNESRVPADFSLAWMPYQLLNYVFRATGSEGSINVRGFKDVIVYSKKQSKGQGTKIYTHDKSLSLRERHKPGFKAELKAFAKYLRGESAENHVSDAVIAQEIVDMFYRR